MPCRVDTTYVNYSNENTKLRKICDLATAKLDVAREKLLVGETPDLSIIKKMDRFKEDNFAVFNGSFMYTHGTPPNEKLINEFERLYKEAVSYQSNKARKRDIEARQRKHRKEDIKRLRIEFAKKGREDLLEKTLGIDYNKPLEPQLGFDPDKY